MEQAKETPSLMDHQPCHFFAFLSECGRGGEREGSCGWMLQGDKQFCLIRQV